MGTKLVLHIGRHKSGTSSIQKFLAKHADQLSEQGVLYPFTGREANGVGHHELWWAVRRAQTDTTALAAMVEQLEAEASGHDLVIISSEGFQNLTQPHVLKNIFGRFDIRVVCYLREFVAYMASGYAQYVHRNNYYVDFESFVRNPAYNAPKFIDKWHSSGLPVEFALFDRSALKGGDVIEDFIARLGLKITSGGDPDANPSISRNLLYFKILSNMAGVDGRRHYNAYRNLAREHAQFRGAIRISEDVQGRLRERADNAAIELAVGQPLRFKDYTAEPVWPDFETWDADLALIMQNSRLAGNREPLRRILKGI
ncbi:hypothetical protein [Maricaulis sp. CAU 1757]